MVPVSAMALPSPEFKILCAYLLHADESGRCWPSVETICRITGTSERSVRRYKRSLETKGIFYTVNGQIVINIGAINVGECIQKRPNLATSLAKSGQNVGQIWPPIGTDQEQTNEQLCSSMAKDGRTQTGDTKEVATKKKKKNTVEKLGPEHSIIHNKPNSKEAVDYIMSGAIDGIDHSKLHGDVFRVMYYGYSAAKSGNPSIGVPYCPGFVRSAILYELELGAPASFICGALRASGEVFAKDEFWRGKRPKMETILRTGIAAMESEAPVRNDEEVPEDMLTEEELEAIRGSL